MRKLGSFVFGTIVGSIAGFVAGSLIVNDDQLDEIKAKIKDNDTLQDLKKKYDNGTELVKNQFCTSPKDVEDDSEIKDFDDIVIDDSTATKAATDASDLARAEDERQSDTKAAETADDLAD